MESKSLVKSVVLGLSIVIGLFLLGLFIYKGFKTFSDKDRVVTVKGLAEMNMMAKSASINVSFYFSGDDLQLVMKQTENKKNSIIAYLTNNGYEKGRIKVNNIDITDRNKYYETRWENGKQIREKIDRYSITQSLTIQSGDVKSTEDKKSEMALGLIRKDLSSDITTKYDFPDLNSIKPQLIAESTKNARIAGEQFANDSQAKLGKIKTASQGQISIVGNYYDGETTEGGQTPQEPYLQRARVVSTIVFFLE